MTSRKPGQRRAEIAKRLAEMVGDAIDLRSLGIDEAAAAELRGRLERFVEEWDSPEMTAYDNYDADRSASRQPLRGGLADRLDLQR